VACPPDQPGARNTRNSRDPRLCRASATISQPRFRPRAKRAKHRLPMSADQKGQRPTIRGFFEEDTPVHSWRPTPERTSGGESSQEYHPPASPPVSPAHRTIETQPVQLSSEIDPHRALTQKLLVRRVSPFAPPTVAPHSRRIPPWGVAFLVSLLVFVSGWLAWQRTQDSPISTDKDRSALPTPSFPPRPPRIRVQVAADLPKSLTHHRPASTKAAAAEAGGPPPPEAKKNSRVNSGLDHVQPHRDSTPHDREHSGTSGPPHTADEGTRPREVWLQ